MKTKIPVATKRHKPMVKPVSKIPRKKRDNRLFTTMEEPARVCTMLVCGNVCPVCCLSLSRICHVHSVRLACSPWVANCNLGIVAMLETYCMACEQVVNSTHSSDRVRAHSKEITTANMEVVTGVSPPRVYARCAHPSTKKLYM